jgi:hypothetical protein
MALLPTSALAVVVATWFLFRQSRKAKLDMPHVDFSDGERTMQRYAQENGSLLLQGYSQYSKKGLPFSVFNYTDPSRPFVVLPTKYLEEVRNASSSKLSFNVFLNKVNSTEFLVS